MRNSAAELPRVDVVDALAGCVAIGDAELERLDRATLRWLARYCAEQAPSAYDVQAAAAAFAAMPDDPESALATLRGLTARG